MVISSIFNSISEEISASIIYVSTEYEIWNDLKEKFQKSNGPWIFQLRRDPMNLTQDQNSISAYFTKLKTMWDELSNFRPNCSYGKCTCSGVKEMNKHYQMESLHHFSWESFSQARGQILLMDPLPPINKVFVLISQEENQIIIST